MIAPIIVPTPVFVTRSSGGGAADDFISYLLSRFGELLGVSGLVIILTVLCLLVIAMFTTLPNPKSEKLERVLDKISTGALIGTGILLGGLLLTALVCVLLGIFDYYVVR